MSHAAPGHGVEERFILLAMASLVAASVWMWIRAPLLLQFFYSHELLAMTHTVTLGFVTSLIMGILYRLVPMSLFVEPKSVRTARWQFWLYLVGVLGMISHFLLGEWHGLGWSAFCVWLAAVLQLWNWRDLVTVAEGGEWVARYALTAMVYLLLAATIGVLMGFAKGVPGMVSLPHASFVSNLYVHINLAAVGWVTNMVFGFQLRLWPRTVGNRKYLPWRYGLLQVGVLGTVYTQWAHTRIQPVFAVMILVAVVWQGARPVAELLRGRAREWELVPLLLLVLTAACGIGLTLGWPPETSELRSRVQLAYAFVGLWGWFVLTINVFLYKLFPMWVWQERFQQDYLSKPVPGMRELYSHGLRKVSLWGLTLGNLVTVVAVVGAHELLLRVAVSLILIGTGTLVANFFLMARWKLLRLEYQPPNNR